MALVVIPVLLVLAALWLGAALLPVPVFWPRMLSLMAHIGLSTLAIVATGVGYGSSDDLALVCALVAPGLLVALTRLGLALLGGSRAR